MSLQEPHYPRVCKGKVKYYIAVYFLMTVLCVKDKCFFVFPQNYYSFLL